MCSCDFTLYVQPIPLPILPSGHAAFSRTPLSTFYFHRSSRRSLLLLLFFSRLSVFLFRIRAEAHGPSVEVVNFSSGVPLGWCRSKPWFIHRRWSHPLSVGPANRCAHAPLFLLPLARSLSFCLGVRGSPASARITAIRGFVPRQRKQFDTFVLLSRG